METFGQDITAIIAKSYLVLGVRGHGYFGFRYDLRTCIYQTEFAFAMITTNTLILDILQSGGVICCWGLCTFCACGRVSVLYRFVDVFVLCF